MTSLKTNPEDLANLPSPLGSWDPRLLAEMAATIALAEEQAPKTGSHLITFKAMQDINPLWRSHPETGISCIQHMNVRAVNQALAYMGTHTAVYERFPNGNILVDDPGAEERVRRAIGDTAYDRLQAKRNPLTSPQPTLRTS